MLFLGTKYVTIIRLNSKITISISKHTKTALNIVTRNQANPKGKSGDGGATECYMQ